MRGERKAGDHTPEKERTEKYALLSVFDKTGIANLARTLDRLGYRIISTGGTAKTLQDAGINIVPIQDITGNPESFDGRMKTISFQAEGGILFDRKNPSHVKQAKELGIKPIDIVVCNLYPFEQTVSDPNVEFDVAVENIDVGGPTMIRSAAKNHKNVLVIVDPKDYDKVTKELEGNSIDESFRQALAAKAFGHLSFYDAQIAKFLNREEFPETLTIPGRKTFALRYGENPHQRGTVYTEPNTDSPIGKLKRLSGRELSYVNVTDIIAGLESVRMFKTPAAVVIKHNSSCGIALGESITEALTRALEADPVSAFGGVVVLNRPIDKPTAEVLSEIKAKIKIQMDIVAAPSVTPDAQKIIETTRKTTGIYTFGEIPKRRRNNIQTKAFDGGFILQDWDDDFERSFPNWKVAGNIKPTDKQLEQMKIAWKFIGRIRSNTVIVVDKNLPMTRGIGAGQTSRIGSTEIALVQAGKLAKGAILASDSFFPFDDCVKLAAKYKIGAIVQQGGSKNDKASITAADKARIPMIFTGERKFWH